MIPHERPFSVVIVGLGGQGVLLLSKVIALAATEQHPFVCRTESRGLSQRGGSVSSEVRFGTKSVAPVIGPASADVVIALDALEGIRAVGLLKASGKIVSNASVIPPLHLLATWRNECQEAVREKEFSERINRRLSVNPAATMVNVTAITNRQTCTGGVNALILGAASIVLPLPSTHLRNALGATVKPTMRKDTESAYDLGRAHSEPNVFTHQAVSA